MSIPFGYCVHLLIQGHQGPLPCFLVFIAEEVYGGEQGSRNTTTVHVLGGLFEHDPKICLFH
jgi:hypothetical protein